MHISKLRLSSDASGRLRALAQRATLTPNLLCRMALAMSLEEGPLTASEHMDETGLEFNAYTLFGPYQPIFLSLLRFVEQDAVREPQALLDRLRGHIERGIRQLAVRVKTPAAELLAGA